MYKAQAATVVGSIVFMSEICAFLYMTYIEKKAVGIGVQKLLRNKMFPSEATVILESSL